LSVLDGQYDERLTPWQVHLAFLSSAAGGLQVGTSLVERISTIWSRRAEKQKPNTSANFKHYA
jgi:hypothetical protein